MQAFAKNWNYRSSETDWQLIARKDIDLIGIASPNDTRKIAVAAAEIGQNGHVRSLGRNEAEAAKMVAAVEKATSRTWSGTIIARPGGTLAKHHRRGRLGKSIITKFLQDWTISKTCRRAELRSGGSTQTLRAASRAICSRIALTQRWLNGSIDKVTAVTETFVKEKPQPHRQGRTCHR